ncbi:hypothetical protein PC117_g26217 [Phytophthora cactorum]|uniref:Uncharacterized protein n=1 Tax=Phytophthora cactorum TaxID=29920 RepID=A0A8T1AM27_9STRA|nr:hypothetical protein PC117_g26217 [Phytophthora cactorum]
MMQRFTRFRLYRKERALLEEARDDSSEELIACAAWRDQKFAVLKRSFGMVSVEVCEDKSEYSLDSKVVETREQRSISVFYAG